MARYESTMGQAMEITKDIFNAAHENLKIIRVPSIVIFSSKVQSGEYFIDAPGFHGFGVSPEFSSVVPTSYDCRGWKDYFWGPNTCGYLPPSMLQSGFVKDNVKATNVAISDDFFKRSALNDIDTSSIDFRFLAGHHDPVTARLIINLGYLADKEQQEELPILVDSLGTALCVRIMHQLGARVPSIDFRAGKIKSAIEYINDNLEKSITLDDIAGAARLSKFHFSRVFKRTYGLSPHEYVAQKRVERAVSMIRNGTMTLGFIALSCGFCSQSHMTKAVRSRTGLTPGQHMKIHSDRARVMTDLP